MTSFLLWAVGAILSGLILGALWLVRRERRAAAATGDVFLAGERVFVNDAGESEAFGAFEAERSSKYLSVVVPAYNEEQRIGVMLDEALAYLEERAQRDASFTYEIIVVSDGSKDGTARVVRGYTQRLGSDKVRCLDLFKNVGKGGAVRRGMLCARGRLLLMADADGASRFADVAALEAAFLRLGRADQLLGFAVGSRAHMRESDDSGVKRSLLRGVLMWGLHVLVMLVGNIWTVQDTQCFPDDDHQILTNRGFLSLADVLAHLRLPPDAARSLAPADWRGLQVANYDRTRGVIVYDTPRRLVINKAAPADALVQLTTATTAATLLATPTHAMYVRDAAAGAFVKVPAAQLAAAGATATHTLLAAAAGGAAPSKPAAEPADAAYWALCGAWLVQQRLPANNGPFAQWFSERAHDARFWSSLTCAQARAVVAGMPMRGDELRLPSEQTRDVAVQVLTHAGLAASFAKAKRGGGWRVRVARDAEPCATAQMTRRGAATTRTWCFTMPARGGGDDDDDSGFVVVRRAVRAASTARVVAASAATIQGNCGFKLFGRRTAHQLFTSLHIERWAFDLELLFLALNYFRTPVAEVPINWQEVDGSKLNVVDATLQILRDLARIRFNYTLGVWKPATQL